MEKNKTPYPAQEKTAGLLSARQNKNIMQFMVTEELSDVFF